MLELLKNAIANVFFVVGFTLELVSKLFKLLSSVFYSICTTLHIQLNTDTGKKLVAIEQSVTKIVTMFNSINSKLEGAKSPIKEENKLVQAIKGDTNVVQLGKKKDDDTKG
jgi:hypothetical protein